MNTFLQNDYRHIHVQSQVKEIINKHRKNGTSRNYYEEQRNLGKHLKIVGKSTKFENLSNEYNVDKSITEDSAII